MLIIIIILLIPILVFATWNFINGYNQSKKSNINSSELNDPKYYELKYKIQFQTAMFAVFAGIIGFYGFTTFENIKKELTGNLSRELDSLNLKIEKTDKAIAAKNNETKNLDKQISEMIINIPKVNSVVKDIISLEQKIKDINAKNILKQNYYIVSSIEKPILGVPQTIYLKDLTTSTGDKLPVFKNPPVILAVTDSNYSASVYLITTESFLLFWNHGINEEANKQTSFKFSLLILER